jgi:NTP pyrophosphatase (non-canonical NTP hydrolase)
MELEEIQSMVFEEYKKNGYAHRWTKEYFTDHPLEFDLLIDLAEVGLINTEVSELLEDIRSNEKEKWATEAADIVIRVLNWCNRKGIDVDNAIWQKHLKNMERGVLHGRTI